MSSSKKNKLQKWGSVVESLACNKQFPFNPSSAWWIVRWLNKVICFATYWLWIREALTAIVLLSLWSKPPAAGIQRVTALVFWNCTDVRLGGRGAENTRSCTGLKTQDSSLLQGGCSSGRVSGFWLDKDRLNTKENFYIHKRVFFFFFF